LIQVLFAQSIDLDANSLVDLLVRQVMAHDMSFIEYEFNLEIVAETMVWQHSFSLKPNKLI
jgi:hypothetical protein